MAITFDAGTDLVDYGDTAILDGLTAFSVSLMVRVENVSNNNPGRRWVNKWGTAAGTRMFHIGQRDSDGNDVQFVVGDGAGGEFTAHSNATDPITTSVWANYLGTWSQPSTGQLYKDGTAIGTSGGTGPSALIDSSAALRIGLDSAGTTGLIGAWCEVGIWNRALSAGEAAVVGKFGCPRMIPRGLVFYVRGTRTGEVRDLVSGLTGTETSATSATHPRVTYPAGPHFDAGVSTFTTGSGMRRTLSNLGTRLGSRQAVEG